MEKVKMHASSVTLPPIYWRLAKKVADENGLIGGASAGLRFIIRDWIRSKGRQPAPAPGRNGGEEEA
ncbi:MAG: hypothetical protein PVJ86_03970 [Phycisphaerales bacterium]